MIQKLFRKRLRQFKKRLKSKPVIVFAIIFILMTVAILYATYMQNKRQTVDPASYTSLLNVIGRVESKGNYNAYYGNPSNTSTKFTDMTISQVMKWQAEHVKQGNLSSAVGRYQIIDSTLLGLVGQLGINPKQKFDKPTQDQLAIALLERRGSIEYVNGKLTREQFAHNLAKEWAGLPTAVGDKPEDSYYAGDGLNKALASTQEVFNAIDQIKPAP